MQADLKWTEYLCMYFQDISLAMIFGWHSSDATYGNNLLQPLMIVIISRYFIAGSSLFNLFSNNTTWFRSKTKMDYMLIEC